MQRIRLGKGVDVLGDGHGCLKERIDLLEKSGYVKGEDNLYRHPQDRRLIYLNDEANKGNSKDARAPYGEYPSVAMMLMMKQHVEAGLAYAVTSNNNEKIIMFLECVLNGIEVSEHLKDMSFINEMDELEKKYGEAVATSIKKEILTFCKSLPSYIIVEDMEGNMLAVITHAGILDSMIGEDSEYIRKFCAWGGSAANIPNWADLHKSEITIIWGHKPQLKPKIHNNTINIDTAGYFGNELTLLRYPELTFISEKVSVIYEEYQEEV